jgi:hypothetical protein
VRMAVGRREPVTVPLHTSSEGSDVPYCAANAVSTPV